MKSNYKNLFIKVVGFIIVCSMVMQGALFSVSAAASEQNNSITFQGEVSDDIRPYISVSCTHNLAASQTITLKMSDDRGIKGYGAYHITSEIMRPVGGISYNVVETTSGTVSLSVNSPGEYIFVAVDTADNYSVSKSIILRSFSLDTNGGSTSLSSVLFCGSDFSFPVPYKSGYIFTGWSTKKPDDYVAQTGQDSGLTGFIQSNYTKTVYANWLSNRAAFADTKRPVTSKSVTENSSSLQASFEMSDESGIKGYYFGTNSDYLKNLFVVSSEGMAYQSINEEGTYYFTAIDNAYNTSITEIVSVNEISLNANGGYYSWYYSPNGSLATLQRFSGKTVLKQTGATFTPDVPSNYPCYFKGWSMQKSNSVGSESITVSKSAVYYAQWEADTTLPHLSLSYTADTASSQTVTLNMSDNLGIMAYGVFHEKINMHWVGPRTYNYDIVQVSSDTATVTITEPGRYRFVAVDSSSNYSEAAEVTFVKYNLDGAGGRVEPSTVLWPGVNVVLPTPVRRDYVFSGWVESDNLVFITDYVEYLKATWVRESNILGDTDSDGSVSIIDATYIQGRAAKKTIPIFYEKAADTDGNGVVEIIDATLIQRYLEGLRINYRVAQTMT